MPAPAVYVLAIVGTVAAGIAFKEVSRRFRLLSRWDFSRRRICIVSSWDGMSRSMGVEDLCNSGTLGRLVCYVEHGRRDLCCSILSFDPVSLWGCRSPLRPFTPHFASLFLSIHAWATKTFSLFRSIGAIWPDSILEEDRCIVLRDFHYLLNHEAFSSSSSMHALDLPRLTLSQFVYDPHIAPAFERWTDEFRARRREKKRQHQLTSLISTPSASVMGLPTKRYKDGGNDSEDDYGEPSEDEADGDGKGKGKGKGKTYEMERLDGNSKEREGLRRRKAGIEDEVFTFFLSVKQG